MVDEDERIGGSIPSPCTMLILKDLLLGLAGVIANPVMSKAVLSARRRCRRGPKGRSSRRCGTSGRRNRIHIKGLLSS
jgi:hypothetical protein